MDPNTRALIMGAAGAGGAEKIYVEDVFSTWLYTGNGTTLTITNGIDLSGKGGLVVSKARNQSTYDWEWRDTARTLNKGLSSNRTAAQYSDLSVTALSTGYSYGQPSQGFYNQTVGNYVDYTFRKAAKYFDVVTYTGNGVGGKQVSHNLGSTPGCVIVKRTDSAAPWCFYHRSLSLPYILFLNTTQAQDFGTSYFNYTAPTSSYFELGSNSDVNANGGSYVAYLFAHDAGGFGDSGADNVISCGSYTGNGSATGPEVTLGWEPQWLLIKRSDSTGDWQLIDNMRGFVVGGADAELNPNLNAAESSGTFVTPTSTGFQLNTTDAGYNASGGTYIYVAIRRGPMKTPTDATKVFQAKVYTGTNVDNRLVTTDIVTDMAWVRQRDDTVLAGMVVGDRLRGQPYLLTGTTAAEVNDADSFDQQLVSTTEYGTAWSSMTGFWVGNDATSKLNANTTADNHVAYAFKRAPGFLDVVCYAGNGTSNTLSHSLGTTPQMAIVKRRSASSAVGWFTNVPPAGSNNASYLNQGTSFANSGAMSLTSTSFSYAAGFDDLNASGSTYVAYLLASCPGVSKVGSYTGSGTTKDIDCGFTAGARFVLIKRTDSAGDWYVWDTARGIVSGDDPYLLLNSTGAEVTNTDYIDPLNSGFQISSTAPAAINANGGTFIYLAIA